MWTVFHGISLVAHLAVHVWLGGVLVSKALQWSAYVGSVSPWREEGGLSIRTISADCRGQIERKLPPTPLVC